MYVLCKLETHAVIQVLISLIFLLYLSCSGWNNDASCRRYIKLDFMNLFLTIIIVIKFHIICTPQDNSSKFISDENKNKTFFIGGGKLKG